jgi:hypothetical protein
MKIVMEVFLGYTAAFEEIFSCHMIKDLSGAEIKMQMKALKQLAGKG